MSDDLCSSREVLGGIKYQLGGLLGDLAPRLSRASIPPNGFRLVQDVEAIGYTKCLSLTDTRGVGW